MTYKAAENRYDRMPYKRCGKSGIKLPVISLGLWQNFGAIDDQRLATEIVCTAFDHGITHFDLANNYGPPPGSAEAFFGEVLRKQFVHYRDELIISTKAGYTMWDGPYGDWGSKKYLMASLDQSLKRMGLDYVDVFYSHRPDPETPIEETMEALAQAVRQGKALYVGLSNYRTEQATKAIEVLKSLGVRCLIHQPKYSMFERWTEEQNLFDLLEEEGVGSIAFSPLAQGLLTNRYLGGIPEDSRVAKGLGFLKESHVTEEKVEKVRALNEIAKNRNQTLAQLALVWVLRDRVTSVLIGVSKITQLMDNLGILENLSLSEEEVNKIEGILSA
ncbi:MAG: aldo/keto reductase [Bacteroidota bacterium]